MPAAGVATFAAETWLLEDDSEARAVVQALGPAAFVLAPVVARLEGFNIRLLGCKT